MSISIPAAAAAAVAARLLLQPSQPATVGAAVAAAPCGAQYPPTARNRAVEVRGAAERGGTVDTVLRCGRGGLGVEPLWTLRQHKAKEAVMRSTAVLG